MNNKDEIEKLKLKIKNLELEINKLKLQMPLQIMPYYDRSIGDTLPCMFPAGISIQVFN